MTTFVPKGNIQGPILPEYVLKKSITAGAKLLYAILCNYAADKDHCWPSHGTLAERMSCSVSSIKNYINELVSENLILVKHMKSRSSQYYILRPDDHVMFRDTDPTSPQTNSDRGQPNPGYINNFKNIKKENTPPLPPKKPREEKSAPSAGGVKSFSMQDFEDTWNLYPKKEAKGFARMAWIKLLKSGQLPSLQEITSSIRNFASTENWKREQGRFVPQMGNWLRGHRWLDPLPQADQDRQIQQQNIQHAVQARQEHEDRQKEKTRSERERLRPAFNAFAARFDASFNEAMAFGTWMYLHSQNIAPTADDVPTDNELGIIDFLQEIRLGYRRIPSMPRQDGKRPDEDSTFGRLFPVCNIFPQMSPKYGELQAVC